MVYSRICGLHAYSCATPRNCAIVSPSQSGGVWGRDDTTSDINCMCQRIVCARMLNFDSPHAIFHGYMELCHAHDLCPRFPSFEVFSCNSEKIGGAWGQIYVLPFMYSLHAA